MKPSKKTEQEGRLEKAPTGIQGLDEITNGGLPKGRPTLVAGGAGSGKTLMAMEFLVHGAQEYNEPGVFMAFEETAEELTKNVKSLGFDLTKLAEQKKLAVDYVYIERSEIEETGEYDLSGLFVRLDNAIKSVKAKRVVLDTVEVLFASLPNEAILRAELRRLFRWLKDRGVTTVITGERGTATLTRHGLEEYVADCVIVLDHRVTEQLSTRRLRIVKYRGSSHGTNEYPFLIGDQGISVLPVTSLGLKHVASNERIPTGISRLDAMFVGKGYYRGTTVLLSGTAGTGKSSVSAAFAKSTCERGERVLYFAFEESESQIVRNMRSIGMDLQPCIDKGFLRFEASRPTVFGLEMHLTTMHRAIETFDPSVVIIDPITNLVTVGSDVEVKSMLTRLIDFLKMKHITALFTSLTTGGANLEQTEVGISSLMDTWMVLRDLESSGERNRGFMILKSRGMAHSNQIREFRLTDHGIELQDVYVGPSGVLTGSARAQQEAKERAAEVEFRGELDRKRREFERKRAVTEAQIAALRASMEADEEEMKKIEQQEEKRETAREEQREEMARRRHADAEVADER
ncbi:MAG: Circadian clock protein kinase KaiC [Syntrophorhabdaceae bacterium PtaU1.Bin034]|nr:MAG: Circadian clock protein kinase KaiC [Syntrophorhabdaceae bacterium PtaU1.Bin034]